MPVLEKDVYASEEGKKALKDFVPVSLDCTVASGATGTATPTGQTKINIDLHERLTGQRDTSSFPDLLVVSPDGEAMLGRKGGSMPIEDFTDFLATAWPKLEEYEAFRAEVAKADKDNHDSWLKAMRTYAKFRMNQQAIAAAEQAIKLDPQDARGENLEVNLLILDLLPSDATQDRIRPVVGRIKTLDPRDEEGALEKALLKQSRALYGVALSLTSPEREKQLAAARKIAQQAIKDYPDAGNLSALYDQVIRSSLKLEDFDTAIQWANQVVNDHPNFPNAETFSALIPQWEEERDKKAAAAKSSDEPKGR
jgi:tetratricopeptide (TPR) repeat protein